jgi:hypothetical protein
MDNKFFTFIKPYLSYIDSGRFFRQPFSWLYTLFAGLNLLLPIYVFYNAADKSMFDMDGKVIITFLLVWLIITFASWVGFQLWWDRKNRVMDSSADGDEFAATPVFAHLIQTMGEWIGTWVGLVGSLTALLTTIILGHEGAVLAYLTGIPVLKSGFSAIFVSIIAGFIIVVFTRFIAESARAIAAIANNTKKG